MKSLFLAVCYTGFFSLTMMSAVLAATTSGTSSFSFLNLPVGARATAMGQAFTSVQNDVQGLPYNPACLSSMAASQLSFQHLTYVDEVNQESLAFGHAGRDQDLSWAVSSNYLRVGGITRTVAIPSGAGR